MKISAVEQQQAIPTQFVDKGVGKLNDPKWTSWFPWLLSARQNKVSESFPNTKAFFVFKPAQTANSTEATPVHSVVKDSKGASTVAEDVTTLDHNVSHVNRNTTQDVFNAPHSIDKTKSAEVNTSAKTTTTTTTTAFHDDDEEGGHPSTMSPGAKVPILHSDHNVKDLDEVADSDVVHTQNGTAEDGQDAVLNVPSSSSSSSYRGLRNSYVPVLERGRRRRRPKPPVDAWPVIAGLLTTFALTMAAVCGCYYASHRSQRNRDGRDAVAHYQVQANDDGEDYNGRRICNIVFKSPDITGLCD